MAVIRSQALARSRGDFSLAPCAVAMQHRFSAASLYLLEQAHGCSGPVQHRPHAVAEGPVAGRPGASAIWVRRVMRFFRQITPAMRRDCVRLCLGPCSAPAHGPASATTVSPQPCLIVGKHGLGAGMGAV